MDWPRSVGEDWAERGVRSAIDLARVFIGPSVSQPTMPRRCPSGRMHLSDPRLDSLRLAADSWQGSTGPRRQVVDQVCLVPDVAAFLEAIALWDERSFLPDPDRRTRLDIAVPTCVSSRAGGAFCGERQACGAGGSCLPRSARAGCKRRFVVASPRGRGASLVWPGPVGATLPAAGRPPRGARRHAARPGSRRSPRPRCSPAPSRWPPAVFSRLFVWTLPATSSPVGNLDDQ